MSEKRTPAPGSFRADESPSFCLPNGWPISCELAAESMSRFYTDATAAGRQLHRAVAFKWIRILWRCWYDRQPCDEPRYLIALQKRRSTVIAQPAQSP
jgi:hypothetical protein